MNVTLYPLVSALKSTRVAWVSNIVPSGFLILSVLSGTVSFCFAVDSICDSSDWLFALNTTSTCLIVVFVSHLTNDSPSTLAVLASVVPIAKSSNPTKLVSLISSLLKLNPL